LAVSGLNPLAIALITSFRVNKLMLSFPFILTSPSFESTLIVHLEYSSNRAFTSPFEPISTAILS